MNEYDSKLVTLFYEINLTQVDEELEDKYESQEDYLKAVRDVYPDIVNDYTCSFMATHSPLNNDHLPEGVENHMHSLVFDKTLGLLLCCSFRIKTDLLHGVGVWTYDAQSLKDILKQIDDKMDGAIQDGWGENGMNANTQNGDIYLNFRSRLKKIVIDIPHVSWLHAKWNKIDDIEHLDWIMNGDAIYNALYQPDIVEGTYKAKAKFIDNLVKKLEESPEVPDFAVNNIKKDMPSPYDGDLKVYEFVKENKDLFFSA